MTRRGSGDNPVMVQSWLLDELAHAGPEHLDAGFIAGYDRKQGYPDPLPDLHILRQHGALTETATVVDLGAGTGRFALAAAAHCRRVVAVDVSPAMLDSLRSRVTDAALTNVDLVRAGFLTYEHRGAAADAVYTRNALHQIPDFWKGIALHRIAQMTRSGGVLRLHDLIYDFQPAQAEAVLHRWMNAAASDPVRGYTAEDFATHVRTEFSTYRWLLEPMLSAAGFDIVDAEFRASVYGAYTCIKRSA
jgi:ubiquinone/menaquinone biosynthesis C-methylase UbiE